MGWVADTIPPTASITTEKNYTNAAKIAVTITFSEPCTGFRCINASICDVSLCCSSLTIINVVFSGSSPFSFMFRIQVTVDGPGQVYPSTFHEIEPDIKYSLMLTLSTKVVYGRVTIKMAHNSCTDQAGNQFTRTNSSVIIVHIGTIFLEYNSHKFGDDSDFVHVNHAIR